MSRVAIVDDSRLARTFAAAALKGAGMTPMELEPKSLASVMEKLRELRPDLVVCDYLMPDCPGLSLVRAIRSDKVLSTTPVVVVSAHRDEVLLSSLQNLGIKHFVGKPVAPKDLIEEVQAALAEP